MGVILVIIVDGYSDSSSHNLAGIEVIVIDFFVLLSAFLGGMLGLVIHNRNYSRNIENQDAIEVLPSDSEEEHRNDKR